MKTAIIFSAENKKENLIGRSVDSSSPFEKMAIALAHSIREYDKEVDVYCGNFTNNKLSFLARTWFKKLKVNFIEDTVFTDIGKNHSFMFLRTFTKKYFTNLLLDKYDYLIYLDIDVLMLAPLKFDFDPTSPMVLVDTMPQWTVNYHKRFLKDLKGPLYYNWIDIINQHNKFVFDLDFTDPSILKEHNADVQMSNRINDSTLTKIEQFVGGYHCLKPIQPTSIFYHYDSLGPAGSLQNLKLYHNTTYEKYLDLFKNTLNTDVTNQENYWENIAKEFE